MTLSSHFNHQSFKHHQEPQPKKIIKTEDDIPPSTRRDSYGNTKFVRGGKTFKPTLWADGSKDSHGAEVKITAKQQQAAETAERLRQQAQAAQSQKLSPRAP
jgi:hypothetical protein